ncbi:N-6 DNA methylase [Flavobacterium sp. NST-5]|uniref:site-specific DNA-methyltransferase (adenine-specific) n=1 Tax=Flavobacterium ichthyis TaxID=2698827 RepID=A0ABW9Z5F5_9FLAO|nr:N-6 DNA methylase [Flavobacterium ichthyis]NBL64073.1 N-6 DNA methylase [Flavobacterium ichthyis]
MQKEFKNIINQFSEDETSLNKIIVSAFIKANALKVRNNTLIKSLIISDNSPLSQYAQLDIKCTFDDLIEAFELAIPKKEQVINGAVYTPNYIKNFIVENSFSKIEKPHQNVLVADIACGCGAFLYTVSCKLKSETNKTYYQIFSENIFGLDISKSSIHRTEILLSLLALANGEDKKEFKFNLHCANALSFDWLKNETRIKTNKGFDLIVGNPPYVRAKNIDQSSKTLLSNWTVTKSGNPDLYIPFFEIGLTQLNDNGVLGYITVNSFYKSVNARQLRKYLQEKEYDLSIIDFGHEKLFEKKSAYTCICLISKNQSKTVSFKKESSSTLTQNGLKFFNKIPYKDLDIHKGWLLNDNVIIENIKRIESAGKPLGEKYKIRNGIATLSNNIYIFKPISETEECFILEQNGKKYEIEKRICRDIIKPNILKHEHEIEAVKEKVIYPYTNGISPLTLMNEKYLKANFPKAYKYLLVNKEKLLSRDKGNGDYGAWYAFGRTQALSDKGYKLLFPYMTKNPHFVFTDQKDMLIYCGYAIFNESHQELKILKRILESKVFEYYMANTSKPYSGGFFSYAKNYVKNFGIFELNEQDRYFLSNGATKEEVDDFLINKYEIKI